MVVQRDAVVFCRVSTEEQGRSGLGLAAQEAACKQLADERGLRIRRTWRETRSGAGKARPDLDELLAYAKQSRCVIIVKDLSRLSRRMSTALAVVESHDVLLADAPTATVLEVRLRALLSAQERDEISRRTRAALAVLKDRGVPLGSARPGAWAGRERARQRGLTLAQAAASKAAADRRGDAYEQVQRLRAKHPTASLGELARKATEAGVLLPHGGGVWSATQVRRALAATA